MRMPGYDLKTTGRHEGFHEKWKDLARGTKGTSVGETGSSEQS